MKKKKINLSCLLILTLIMLISRNIFAAPLCLEEEENSKINNDITNKEENIEEQNNNLEKSENEKTGNDDQEEEKEIEISADNKIEVDSEQGIMIVTGNAFVREGLTSLQADMLTAFTCESKNGDTKIIQINADNNVIIVSDQGKAFAERGIYFVEDKLIELYDKVKLEKEGDILVGDKGIFNVLTGKGEISIEPNKEGGRKKVYGIIRSKKK